MDTSRQQQNLYITILCTTLIFGLILIFYSYQRTAIDLQIKPGQVIKHYLSDIVHGPAATEVHRPGAPKRKHEPAKYASFTKENAVRNHFESAAVGRPADIVTFEIPFNETANDLSNVTVWKYGEHIRILEDAEVDKIDLDCVDLQINFNITQICVYKSENDLFISGHIRNFGNWEGHHLDNLGKALQGKPDMVFIDVGCNIGAFTTYSLLFGNPVVCIEPLMAHLQVMMKTLRLTKDEKNVILLWNAVSDKHEKVVLSQGQEDNMGSIRVSKLNETFNNKTKAVKYEVETMLLDDLQGIFVNRRIFIKMDIESYEWKALAGGENFFKKNNVCYVVMEIAAHKSGGTGLKIYSFLSKFGLYPFTDVAMTKSLNITQLREWPLNPVFVKNTTECRLN